MKSNLSSLLALAMVSSISCAHAGDKLAFTQVNPNEFLFDTGVLKGKLGGDGRTKGLSSVVHVPSGTRLDSSMGLLSHYRVFSVGKRYGVGAWDWPGKMTLQADGSVLTEWASLDGRPFVMTARYRISSPETVDLETTVRPETDLKGFECFVASYFTPGFTNASALVKGQKGPELVRAKEERGVWQVFPRDDAALRIVQDGRWKLEPHPVDWHPLEKLDRPFCMRASPGTGVMAMLLAPAADCFAICTPHEQEAHYSMYLSLFGRDIRAGETATARARLIMDKYVSGARAVLLHDSYTRSVAK